MKQITRAQRYTISAMKQQGCKTIDIAKTIKVHKTSIYRELARNSDSKTKEYKDELAQKKCDKRKKEKPHFTKQDEDIHDYIRKKLIIDRWQPEQIANRAKLEGIPMVSCTVIYRIIAKDRKAGGILYKYLRRHKPYRKLKGQYKDTRGILKNRVDISQRPAIVEKKERFGDFEIDTVIGANHKGALLTINDRVTGLVFIRKLDGKNAEQLAQKAIETLLPWKNSIHTITGDNGKEFAEHEKMANTLKILFYFAKPYHSWERGANENTNGLIRQFFPKKSDFTRITDAQVSEVESLLNNRPRKRLGFFTPNEIKNQLLFNKKVAFAA